MDDHEARSANDTVCMAQHRVLQAYDRALTQLLSVQAISSGVDDAIDDLRRRREDYVHFTETGEERWNVRQR